VLNEMYVTLTRKLEPGLPAADARADVVDLSSWGPLAINAELIAAAWTVEDRFGLSYWDSLVVAAAQVVGASHLLTEDLQDGQDFDGVVVIDPFRLEPQDLSAG
jgi:predicted nucleic acid-binding protein